MNIKDYTNRIFSISDSADFNRMLNIAYKFQLENNPIFKQYVSFLNPKFDINNLSNKPYFLPIEFFRQYKVISGHKTHQKLFESSSTTNTQQSKHYVADANIYHRSIVNAFERQYGNINDYAYLALLPGYIERDNASLVYMLEYLIEKSNSLHNGFFLNQYSLLNEKINLLEESGQKYMLWGVTHALLDFSKQYNKEMRYGIVMETGGMKGHGKEMVRSELHDVLRKRLRGASIHSEYGMTELLSQAYAKDKDRYHCPPWMKVFVRDISDSLSVSEYGSGGLNIIDLANIYSSCFIETSDLGTVYPDGSFTVTGRFDNADIRGCNLMV